MLGLHRGRITLGIIPLSPIPLVGRMRFSRTSIGCGRYRSRCSSLAGGDDNDSRYPSRLGQNVMHAVHTCISTTPLIYIAWAAMASPAAARNVVQKTEPSSMILGNLRVQRGEMSQEAMEDVLDYYMCKDIESTKKANKSKPVRRTSDLKVEVLKDSTSKNMPTNQQEMDKGQNQKHPNCDSEVAKVELKALFAIVAVCIVAGAYWQWKRREAAYGLETELRDFSPIRVVNTTETEEEKEFMRVEAMRRIQRAKQKEEEFRAQTQLHAETSTSGRDQGSVDTMIDSSSIKIDFDVSTSTNEHQEHQEEIYVEEEEHVQVPHVMQQRHSTSPRKDSPLILGLALFSVMVDDIKREINNAPKYVLPDGRVLGCSRDARPGKSMSVKTSRVKVVKPPNPRKVQTKDILLAPLVPIANSMRGKKSLPLISEKYNPMSEFHEFVSSSNGIGATSDRDPFTALMHSLKSFNGFQIPQHLRKYDPVSNLDQIESFKGEDDMISSFVRALISLESPKASHILAKYDPLQGMEDIVPEKGTSEYNLLQGMLNAKPHGASEYSIVKALLKTNPDASHYDVWKALVDISPPPKNDDSNMFKVAGSFVDYMKKPVGVDFSKDNLLNDLSPKDVQGGESDSIEL